MKWQDRRGALDTIHRIAIARGFRVATAESLTAGMIVAALADTPGSSKYLQGGIVAYNIDQKVELLGVNREQAAACNCVSDEIALQMCLGAQNRMNAECVIAVTGYAEPWPEAGVTRAHAYFNVVVGPFSVGGRIELDLLDRNEARDMVTTRTLCTLAEMLEEQFAI